MDRYRRLVTTLIFFAVLGSVTGLQQPAALSAPTGPQTPNHTSFQVTTIDIPTYPYASYLTSHTNTTYNMTYQTLDWDGYRAAQPSPTPQSYTLLILENEYLRVSILPELGGRVYQFVYKPTGNNELYQNPVIKPSPWGPPEMGWWLAAGGIEWCLPVEEHGYESSAPWTWTAIESSAGVTVTVRDSIAANRLRAAIDLFLPADRGYLAIGFQLENPTAEPISYKYWTNAMLAPGPANAPTANLHWIFNAAQMSVHSSGDCRLPGCYPTEPVDPRYRFSWPVHNGIDFSVLGNWREWLGFFEYPQAAANFVGAYDRAADEGIARVFPAHIARGAKGFAFGWADPLDWRKWTDDGSGYVELHGGLAPTFWDSVALPAGDSISWIEYWYPVAAIGDLTTATAEAALNVQQAGDTLTIGIQPTRAWADRQTALHVWERATCSPVARQNLPPVGPDTPFLFSLPAGGRALDQLALVYMDQEQNLLAAVNPVDCLLPHAWVEPLPPTVATTAFTVQWNGTDDWGDVIAYDVQVRDGVEGTWMTWLSTAATNQATFHGVHGHSYFFRARARDVAGNWGSFTDEDWGQAWTTVLTEPAAVLVTSTKTATPRLFDPRQAAGQLISYTVRIENSGTATATATLSDTPPLELLVLTTTLTASQGAAPLYDDGLISWQGTLAPGGAVSISYALSPTAATPIGTPLLNAALIGGSVLGPFTRQATVRQVYLAYMPMAMRNG